MHIRDYQGQTVSDEDLALVLGRNPTCVDVYAILASSNTVPMFIRYPFEIASIWINIVWTYENAALDTGSVPSHNGSSSYRSSNRYGPGHRTISIPTHSLTRDFCLVEILFTNILWLHSRNLDVSAARCCSVFISVYTKRETRGPLSVALKQPIICLQTTRKLINKARCL